ncbi:acetyl-CoA synthetase [Plakobranchus ocellatus]|uniref:Acetyl-coenzyme A synthetase n=1 Tax=Plakobranchus ocellatus TaxID=259542 RepID=A0AAV3YU57_9GAST|nr:acetyl-CoA synthetase [Plakobranchus ocellatus]
MKRLLSHSRRDGKGKYNDVPSSCATCSFDLIMSDRHPNIQSGSTSRPRYSAGVHNSRRPRSTTPFPEFPDLKTHEELYNFSLDYSETFWGTLARSRLTWSKDFTTVTDSSFETKTFGWFHGGELNASVNCIDRHLNERGEEPALIWEKDEPGESVFYSYRKLSETVGQIGNMLKNSGVKAGDRVTIYLSNSPTAVATMLACARIGAIHNVVFAGFSANALAARINDAQSETVITANTILRGGKLIPAKKTVDEAVTHCPCVRRVFVHFRTEVEVPMGKMDINMDKAMASEPVDCTVENRGSEDTLFMLYTSGSTGAPKGLIHSTAGYLLYANVTFKHAFDYNIGEKFGCVADIGWITGHSYVLYGPLSNGATTLLFESTPQYPDPGRYWEMVERLKLNHIYLSPTALRLLLKSGDGYVKKYNRSSLRKLGCVGEPLNHEAWEWYHKVVGEGRCDIIDTWWQTETGGICISPRPSEVGAEIIPAMPMRPMPGISLALVDNQGKETDAEKGALCIKKPWPGLARSIYGNHDRFLQTYFSNAPGLYYTGDGAHRYNNSHFQIIGRMDDVLNVSGHRLGTAEIEDVMDDHPDVSETAVIGFPHDIKGEGVYAYAVLKDERKSSKKEIEIELKSMIKTRIGGLALPEIILFTPSLPRTRSGKIMRRILRKIAANDFENLGDTSTLADPDVIKFIVDKHKELFEEFISDKK